MSPEEIVDGQLVAYNAHHLERFLDFFVEDVPVFSFPSGEVLVDRSGPAFRERFRVLFASKPEVYAELVSRVVKDRIVVDQERMTDFPGGEVRHVVALYEVGAEKIERVWFVA